MVAPDGPLLIFAGAGSGKTRVLTHRIAYVLATRDVRPQEICAVTFTNKAAREMRGRVETLLGGSTSGMWIGTFHALGARILRRDGSAIGIPSSFSIYDEADRAAALRRAFLPGFSRVGAAYTTGRRVCHHFVVKRRRRSR